MYNSPVDGFAKITMGFSIDPNVIRAKKHAYRFLVVDDSPYSRSSIRLLLEDNGHLVREAGGAEEAVKLYQAEKPDIVTMDMNMPNRTGLEAIWDILRIDPAARFIVVSAVNQKITLDLFARVPPCEYVPKPIVWDKLCIAIDKVMAKKV